MLQSRIRNSGPILEFSSLGLFWGTVSLCVCVCLCFHHVDLLSNYMGQVLDVPKAKLDKKLYCHAEKKKAVSAEVLNCSFEQKQLLCMYLLCKIKKKMKKSLKLGKMLNSMKKIVKHGDP